MDIEDKLKDIGLGPKPASVYMTLLQIGEGSVTEIAALSKIKRTTCYDILEDLLLKRLINKTYRGSRKIFTAKAPETLLDIPRDQEQKILEMLPELKAFYNTSTIKPKLQYYEGIEGIRAVEYQILDSTTEEYYYFGAFSDMIDTLGIEFFKKLVEDRLKRGIWSNALRVKSKETDLKESKGSDDYMRRVRYMPKAIHENTVAVTITDRKVFILSSLRECYALVIESPELVALMRGIWQMLWDVSEEA